MKSLTYRPGWRTIYNPNQDPNIKTGTIRNPLQKLQLIHDPLCFKIRKSDKFTIRALFKVKSDDPKTYSPASYRKDGRNLFVNDTEFVWYHYCSITCLTVILFIFQKYRKLLPAPLTSSSLWKAVNELAFNPFQYKQEPITGNLDLP